VNALANMLGPRVAPLAQHAVNLVSAAFLARTLSASGCPCGACSAEAPCSEDAFCGGASSLDAPARLGCGLTSQCARSMRLSAVVFHACITAV
jgi:hypothetical protein